MRRLRYLGLAALAAVSVGAVGNQALGAPALRGQAAPQQTNECNGIRECLRAQGPWVVVPARGEVLYLLDCPRRQGIVGGVDALSSASNVQVQFEAQLGAPVAPGRTTTRYALFRAYSTNGHRGLFQPRIGCIRTSASPRSTTAVKATPGAPAALAATTIRVGPGAVQTSTIGCVPGQRLVRVWTARAFRTERMPPVALADALDVEHEVRGQAANVAIASSEALPRSARAEVQLGVGCSQR